MRKIMQQVAKVIIASTRTPEEAVDYFIKNLIKDILSLSNLGPRKILSKVIPLKNQIVKYRLDDANRFIEAYNDLMAEKALDWVEIAKKWKEPKDLMLHNCLIKESLKFENTLKDAFDELRLATENHRENLLFMSFCERENQRL